MKFVCTIPLVPCPIPVLVPVDGEADLTTLSARLLLYHLSCYGLLASSNSECRNFSLSWCCNTHVSILFSFLSALEFDHTIVFYLVMRISCTIPSTPYPAPLPYWDQRTVKLSSSNMLSDIKFPALVNATSVFVLDWSHNSLNGSFPIEAFQLTALTNLNLDDNQLTGQLPDSWGSLPSLVALQLGGNQFYGQIPGSLGLLSNLQIVLDLSRNSFTEGIPGQLGNLIQLQSLDLSHNDLSGQIPTALSNMLSLTQVNLSYNDLVGELPPGSVWQDLEKNATSFIGNPNLCLASSCTHKSSSSHKRDLSPGVIAAISVGALIAVLTLCASLPPLLPRLPAPSLVPKVAMPGGRPAEPLPGARQPGSRDLPVRRSKKRIVEKVQENRVTLIFADTGSGKSSQVPQMLLDEGLGPILCTQPRRLAVVAVAKRVAEERGCSLGDDVGYQIGQLNLSTTRSKIVFKTAGILFEELRTNGMGALSKYKVVILDEVHERSVESDLVLTCMKQIIRTTSVKLVLMSATANLLLYEEYFKELDRGEGVEKIAIQNIGNTLQSVILNTKVVHLEQAVKSLGNIPEHAAVLQAMNENVAPAEKSVDIGVPTQRLIKDLIVHLHLSDPDFSKNVLVFLPTYRALEQQWSLLKTTGEPFQVYVLHSSIDMEHSIRAMEACPLKQRKVILATNVAESSITIPGVSFVIDSCRSLEVYWDGKMKRHQPRLVWVSESQANQRKGRTGRTCDGVVYRLVPRNLKFEKFETPSMQLLSLRKQVLMILCASSKALNDPAALLRKSMNPPAPETVQDALDTLEDMNAVHVDARGKHQPTLYGQLLVSLPLSLEYSALVVRGGQLGYPRESAVLAAIMDSTPAPILKPFGDEYLYKLNVESYYNPGNNGEGQSYLPQSTVMLANLNAFEFWQQSFKDKRRMDSLLQQAKSSSLHINSSQKFDEEVLESDWCFQHRLSLTSLRSIAETVDVVIEALHRFRPEFLVKISGPPSYIMTDRVQHVCSSQAFNGDAWHNESIQETGKASDGHNGNDQWSGSQSAQGDDAGAWDDWSFQESEKTLTGYEQVNGSDEGRSSSQAIAGDKLNGYEHVDLNNQMSRNGIFNGHLETNGNGNGSPETNGHGNFNGSHERNGSGLGTGRNEVKAKNQQTDNAEVQGNNPVGDSPTCTSVPYTQSGTFHSPEDEQILSALIIEVSRYHLMIFDGWFLIASQVLTKLSVGPAIPLQVVSQFTVTFTMMEIVMQFLSQRLVKYQETFDPHPAVVDGSQTCRGTQQPAVSEVTGGTLGEVIKSSPPPMCSYFQKGMCNKGASCLYSHSPYADPVRCRFVDSPGGCRYGDTCRYWHGDVQRYVLPSDNVPINFDEAKPTEQSMLDLLPVLNDNEFILLFGEGDFSFADSLSNYIAPSKIFATSLDREEIFLRDPRLTQRLTRLAQFGMQLMWNVDVTALVTSSGKGKRIISKNLTRSIPWSRVRCILWNFPFADVDENAAKHQDLMFKFFASLSIIMISARVHSVPVIITLCNDQYCRWQVERAARDSFFFLRTSAPFDVNTFGGYHPMRNNLQTTFPVHRPLIYMFELHTPRDMLNQDFIEDVREFQG